MHVFVFSEQENVYRFISFTCFNKFKAKLPSATCIPGWELILPRDMKYNQTDHRDVSVFSEQQDTNCFISFTFVNIFPAETPSMTCILVWEPILPQGMKYNQTKHGDVSMFSEQKAGIALSYSHLWTNSRLKFCQWTASLGENQFSRRAWNTTKQNAGTCLCFTSTKTGTAQSQSPLWTNSRLQFL